METFLERYWLDILTTTLGIAYIILEYKAIIWLWAVGFLMQSLGIVLYYQKGLYADCGMEFYYIAVTVYGFFVWKFGKKEGKQHDNKLPVTHFPKRQMAIWIITTMAIWGAIYIVLTNYTDSRVPVADSFTTALSVVGVWALARKYVEQWIVWILVDVVTSALYYYKDIPFKATLYAFYVVVAIMGYQKWKKMAAENNASSKN